MMRKFFGLEELPREASRSAVTIGKFDGVHVGHREILSQLCAISREHKLISTVVTFDRHPTALLSPEERPHDIVSLTERLELIESAGVDQCVVLQFDEHLAALSPEEFAQRILVDALHAQVVLAGHDFRFGENATGDITALQVLGKQLGFEVVLIDDVSVSQGTRASSSLIRQYISEGDIAQAALLLGRFPKVAGQVVHGAKRGRELGFPTANLSAEATGVIPADGVYAGWFHDHGHVYPCAISVGMNPTFDDIHHRSVEAYLLDQNQDLYDHLVEIEFVSRLRGMVAYAGVEPLIEQMKADVEKTREVLGLEKK
jgi:riboflavin kinase/FMN adenylyltransferase